MVWTTYRNDDLGFSFEFPGPCGLRVSGNTFIFGGTSYLEVMPAAGLSLVEYVQQLMVELDQKDGPYSPVRDDRLANREPKVIILHAQIAHHQSVIAVLEGHGMIYRFWSRLSSACILPEAGLTNPDSFYHSVETFAFVR